jgi:hypothetical protein
VVEVLVPGVPPSDVKLAATASVGTLSDFQPIAPGRYRATYQAPKNATPSIALVRIEGLIRNQPERAWTTIPIHTEEVLELVTTKPRTQVTVLLGDPRPTAVSDDKGKVEIPLVVPPGVQSVDTVLVDQVGNRRTRSVSLGLPGFARAHLHPLGAPSASWADPQPLVLEVFAIDANGNPSKTPPELKVDSGGLSRPESAGAPGVFRVRYTAPPRIEQKAAVIRASFSEPGTNASELQIVVRPGPTTEVRVEAEPREVVASAEGATVLVRVATEDAKDNRTDDVPTVRVEGRDIARRPQGDYLVQLPPNFGGKSQVVVEASVGALQAAAPVLLRPGPPAKTVVQLERTLVRAGGAPLYGTLELFDAFGNPVPGAKLEAVTPHGPAVVTDAGGGKYAFELKVPPEASQGMTDIDFRADGDVQVGSERVGVLPYEGELRLGLGAWARGQHNFAHATSVSPTLEVAVKPGYWPIELTAIASVPFYGPANEAFLDETGLEPKNRTKSATLRGMSFGIGARAALALSFRWAAYLSASGGGQQIRGSVAVPESTIPAQEIPISWGFWVRGTAGLSVRVGPGRALVEVGGTHAPTQGGVVGNLGGLSVGVGYLVDVL